MQTVANPKRWWALGLVATAQFLIIMDTSIIGVALPEMAVSLGFDQADLSWVFNAYVITFGGLLLLGGRLSDLFGARRIFSAGFVVLLAGSLLAGMAGSASLEIAARAVQGAGAAMIAPSALAILMSLFAHDPRELTKALALYGAAAPAGGTAGVFLGGVLTEWLSWPWVFYINIPIGLAVLALTPRWAPAGTRTGGRVDLVGSLTITAAISIGVFGVIRAPELGWLSDDVVLSLGAAGALLAVFVATQRRRRDPLVPRRILRTPNLVASNVVMALLGAAWVPMWFFLNLYVQQVLGYSPFQGGAALLPMTIVMMLLMVGVTERVVARFGLKGPLVAGMLLLAIGLIVLSTLNSDGGFVTDVLPGSIIAAAGMSLAYIPAMLAAMASVKPEETGLASGLVNTTYQVGSALGLAAMTAVAATVTDHSTDLVSLTDGFSAALVGAALIAGVGAAVAAARLRRPPAEHDEPARDASVLVP